MCTNLSLILTSILNFNSRLTRQPLKRVNNLAVLSVFRVFCSFLPSATFCPQIDLFAFKYSVSKSKESTMPKPSFSCNIAITEEMRCYFCLVLQACLQGLFLKDDGGNELSHLLCEFPQHRIIGHSHLAIIEQDLRLWTRYCPSFG